MAKWNEAEIYAFMKSLRGVTTIGKRAEDGEARSFEILAKDLPLRSLEIIFEYGFQRKVNDLCGGSDKTLVDKFEKAEKIILDLYEGSLGLSRARSDGDPMGNFFRAALMENLSKEDKKKLSDMDAEKRADTVEKLVNAHKADLEPRALELKRLDDEKRAGKKAIAAKIDLKSLGL